MSRSVRRAAGRFSTLPPRALRRSSADSSCTGLSVLAAGRRLVSGSGARGSTAGPRPAGLAPRLARCGTRVAILLAPLLVGQQLGGQLLGLACAPPPPDADGPPPRPCAGPRPLPRPGGAPAPRRHGASSRRRGSALRPRPCAPSPAPAGGPPSPPRSAASAPSAGARTARPRRRGHRLADRRALLPGCAGAHRRRCRRSRAGERRRRPRRERRRAGRGAAGAAGAGRRLGGGANGCRLADRLRSYHDRRWRWRRGRPRRPGLPRSGCWRRRRAGAGARAPRLARAAPPLPEPAPPAPALLEPVRLDAGGRRPPTPAARRPQRWCRRAPGAARRPPARAAGDAAGLANGRAGVRVFLTSTATALLRPWLKLCRTMPVSTVFLSSSRPPPGAGRGRSEPSDPGP